MTVPVHVAVAVKVQVHADDQDQVNEDAVEDMLFAGALEPHPRLPSLAAMGSQAAVQH